LRKRRAEANCSMADRAPLGEMRAQRASRLIFHIMWTNVRITPYGNFVRLIRSAQRNKTGKIRCASNLIVYINRLKNAMTNRGQEMGKRPKKLLTHVHETIRVKHYSVRTEEAYVTWVKAPIPCLLTGFESAAPKGAVRSEPC